MNFSLEPPVFFLLSVLPEPVEVTTVVVGIAPTTGDTKFAVTGSDGLSGSLTVLTWIGTAGSLGVGGTAAVGIAIGGTDSTESDGGESGFAVGPARSTGNVATVVSLDPFTSMSSLISLSGK